MISPFTFDFIHVNMQLSSVIESLLKSFHIIEGVAVAGLEFDHRDHVRKAERSWKSIANALQCVLGCDATKNRT